MALLLTACVNSNTKPFQGWVEADLLFVAPDETGRVQTLKVREGSPVKEGELLFALDDDLQQAEVAQATATVANARIAYDRAEKLLKTAAGTQRSYDEAQAALREAEARFNSVQTKLARRRVFSPASGTIQQLYYRPGELVMTGRPVLSLLPPGNIKIRFYVPEAALPKIALGEIVHIECDGCADDLTARISFVSQSAEYTPPVIYSLEERAKLVFLVEARSNQPEKLRVGQPVTVSLSQQEASR
ncbi:MAG TPA: efflux RND transporter periplasmic adaptor subunit [Xanthobacteraceae bacterium]|nr:efflux RND transporter periplasmic adaptor subunit [Xanthobacteraceae bacterium]